MKDKPKKEAVVRMFQSPKGMHDVLPADQPYWERIESAIRDAARSYNFHRIDPPILESADLFRRTVGEETDLVEKEMYTLKTRGGDVLALRPEFTASIMRAYLEHNLSRTGQPQKLFHFGPVFRHDRPQLGRTRQFSQTGFDIIGGVNDAVYDAKILMMCAGVLHDLKIKDTVLKINSIGCKVCRPIYKKQLQNYYKNHEKNLCAECAKRVKTNPLRLLDCKDPQCEKLKEKAPNFLDKICSTCSKHFKQVLEYLDELQTPYVLDNQLVRGLDYYDRTVFEIFAEGAGSELGAFAGGGRYDYLMEYIGGRLTPAVGGSFGVERLIAVMKAREIVVAPKLTRRVFVAHAGDSAKKKAVKLAKELVDAGIPISEALAKDSLRAQLKSADKEGVGVALILGQKEIYEESVIIRDMRTGLQDSVKIERVVEEVKKRWR